MSKRFKNLLISIQDQSLGEQRKSLKLALHDWMGAQEQVDDICVMGIRL